MTGDWETDTLRTGCLGIVTINLPRIVNESKKDKNKFFEILRERFEMAARALRIKYRNLKRNAKVRLPFLTQSSNGDTYFRIEYCSRIVNLAGFNEAVEAFCNKELHNEESVKFAEEIVKNLIAFRRKLSRRHGKRLFSAILPYQEASRRLVLIDIEKYGIAKVNYSGTRDDPYFSTTRRLIMQKGDFLRIASESFDIEKKLEGLKTGGSLSIIELEEDSYKPEQLMKLTEQLVRNQYLDFFTYNRITTSCENCSKSWYGSLHKCPSCGSMSTLTVFNRFQST